MTDLKKSQPANLLFPIPERFVEEELEAHKPNSWALSDLQKLKLSHIIAADDKLFNAQVLDACFQEMDVSYKVTFTCNGQLTIELVK
jgi:hypothetical protein